MARNQSSRDRVGQLPIPVVMCWLCRHLNLLGQHILQSRCSHVPCRPRCQRQQFQTPAVEKAWRGASTVMIVHNCLKIFTAQSKSPKPIDASDYCYSLLLPYLFLGIVDSEASVVVEFSTSVLTIRNFSICRPCLDARRGTVRVASLRLRCSPAL